MGIDVEAFRSFASVRETRDSSGIHYRHLGIDVRSVFANPVGYLTEVQQDLEIRRILVEDVLKRVEDVPSLVIVTPVAAAQQAPWFLIQSIVSVAYPSSFQVASVSVASIAPLSARITALRPLESDGNLAFIPLPYRASKIAHGLRGRER